MINIKVERITIHEDKPYPHNESLEKYDQITGANKQRAIRSTVEVFFDNYTSRSYAYLSQEELDDYIKVCSANSIDKKVDLELSNVYIHNLNINNSQLERVHLKNCVVENLFFSSVKVSKELYFSEVIFKDSFQIERADIGEHCAVKHCSFCCKVNLRVVSEYNTYRKLSRDYLNILEEDYGLTLGRDSEFYNNIFHRVVLISLYLKSALDLEIQLRSCIFERSLLIESNVDGLMFFNDCTFHTATTLKIMGTGVLCLKLCTFLDDVVINPPQDSLIIDEVLSEGELKIIAADSYTRWIRTGGAIKAIILCGSTFSKGFTMRSNTELLMAANVVFQANAKLQGFMTRFFLNGCMNTVCMRIDATHVSILELQDNMSSGEIYLHGEYEDIKQAVLASNRSTFFKAKTFLYLKQIYNKNAEYENEDKAYVDYKICMRQSIIKKELMRDPVTLTSHLTAMKYRTKNSRLKRLTRWLKRKRKVDSLLEFLRKDVVAIRKKRPNAIPDSLIERVNNEYENNIVNNGSSKRQNKPPPLRGKLRSLGKMEKVTKDSYIKKYIRKCENNIIDDVPSKRENKRYLTKLLIYPFEVIVLDWIGKYGTNPWRILVTMPIVNLLFALLYYCLPVFGHVLGKGHLFWDSAVRIQANLSNILPLLGSYEWDTQKIQKIILSIYHSMITFLTIGYGDFNPGSILMAILSGLEGFIGLFLMSYFTVAFTRKILR